MSDTTTTKRIGRGWAGDLFRTIRADASPIEVSLIATCVLFTQGAGIGHAVIILGIAGLLLRPLRHTAGFWIAAAAFLAWSNYESWWIVDNHKYLINYWALALGLSYLGSNPAKAIAWNARILIGLAFLLAVLQKAVSGDYLDGTFFHFLLINGTDFAPVADWLGGLPRDVTHQNFLAVEEMLRRYDSTTTLVQLQETPRIYWIAQALTWWTQGIEALVAVAFLWPAGRGISKWRDIVLVGFLFTTYVLAQVMLFGWVLAAMGMAQCESRSRGFALLYALAFLAIVTYTIPLEVFPWTP